MAMQANRSNAKHDLEQDHPLTPREAAARAGISPSYLSWLRQTNAGPKCIQLGYRTIRYRASDVDEWMASRTERFRR